MGERYQGVPNSEIKKTQELSESAKKDYDDFIDSAFLELEYSPDEDEVGLGESDLKTPEEFEQYKKYFSTLPEFKPKGGKYSRKGGQFPQDATHWRFSLEEEEENITLRFYRQEPYELAGEINVPLDEDSKEKLTARKQEVKQDYKDISNGFREFIDDKLSQIFTDKEWEDLRLAKIASTDLPKGYLWRVKKQESRDGQVEYDIEILDENEKLTDVRAIFFK